jgi:hypothetical protein
MNITRVRVRGGRIVGSHNFHVANSHGGALMLGGGTRGSPDGNVAKLRQELAHLSVRDAPKPREKKYMAVKLGYRR